MLAVVDYGVGNLFSLKSSLRAVNVDAVVASDETALARADGIILPGVGAFADAAEKLQISGMAEAVQDQVEEGKPLMGICLGMQLLFERSLEYGEHAGLGLLKGTVRPLAGYVPETYKIPQIGWNYLTMTERGNASSLFQDIHEGSYVYFVHSYYAADCDESVLAYTEYGAPVTAAVGMDNVYGCQFHPEKSGDTGLRILKAFSEVCV
ncbi:MAG TPA: imidazole glycerol phosphate synthase subunit HisH [Methanocorpusculum sp.]|nr:imidazole glycerol phosphate synthase subunit HisH [Methanocorpusculum sp.]